MTKHLFLFFALLCAIVQGAWAQTDRETPLTLEAKTAGMIVINYPKSGMQYSVNGGAKTAVSTKYTQFVIDDVAIGDKVEFYGTGTSLTRYAYSSIQGTAECYIYGNIMSLVDEYNFATATTLTSESAFATLFQENAKVFNHPTRKLVLPATTLTNNCYEQMFCRCTNLTEAPVLPATTLKNYCYKNMFAGCTKLNFMTCYATSSAPGATSDWLWGVPATGTFVKANEMESWSTGTDGIPSGWTVVQGAWDATGITDVMLIGGDADEVNSLKTKYTNEGWTVIDQDLNEDAGGDYIFLLYKTGKSGHITSLYLKTGDDRADNITAGGHTYNIVPVDGSEHFKGNKGDLNSNTLGEDINLYYTKETEGFNAAHYLTSISFSNIPSGGLDADGDGIAHDLNKGAGGDFIFLYPSYGAAERTLSVTTEAELQEAVRYSTATVQLGGDIALGSVMCVGGANTITIDLNGHTLSRNLSDPDDYGSVIRVEEGGTLTVKDSSGNNSGKISGGKSTNGGGINNHGTLYFQGGTITGCSATNGGGIFNAPSTVDATPATLTMTGGVIDGCTAVTGGGGIYNYAGSTVTIDGGIIDGCSANNSGGIYNAGTMTFSSGEVRNCAATLYVCGGIGNDGNLTISGGTISGNRSAWGGGGVLNNENATLTMTGGRITGNHSNTYGGGGVYNYGTLNMSGNPVISGNTSTANGVDNVFLNDNKVISVTGAFAEGTKIGVAPSNTSNAITSNYSTYNQGTTPDNFFSSDTEFHKLSLNGDSEVALVGAEGNWIDYRAESYSNQSSRSSGYDKYYTIYIESEAEFALMAYNVNNTEHSSFDHYTFILNADLDMSAHYWTPIGAVPNYRFEGNFNGNGHTISGIYVNSEGLYNGLFGIVAGSSDQSGYQRKGCDYIKNFVLKDSYIKGGNYTGGVVGFMFDGMTLENVFCQADVTGGSDVGGIVGKIESFYELNSTRYVTTINNCLYLSGTVSATGNRGAVFGTIVKHYNLLSLSNNYYIDPTSYVGNDNDVRAYPITTIIPEGVTVNYTSSGVTYDGIRYAPAGNAYLTVKHDFGKSVAAKVNGDDVVAVEGAIPFIINPAKAESYEVIVTLNDYEFTGSGTEAEPYLITSQDDWNYFASCLNSGSAPDNYSGTYFKLDTDIIVNQRMGTNDHPFKGIFDGGGNKLTLDFGAPENYLNLECAAFYRIDNSTIQNLKIAGSIYSSAQHNASLAVKSTGSNNYIQNCISSVSINSSIDGDCTNGGFISLLNTNNTHVYFNGCAFTGELVGANATNWGGFVGWREYYTSYNEKNQNFVSFTDCLFAPTKVSIAIPDGSNSRTFCRSRDNQTSGASYTNSYYTTVLQAVDGGGGFSLTTAPANIGNEETEYDVSDITRYANGLKYDGLYYMAPEAVSFANDADNSSSITAKNDWFVNVTLSDRTLYRDGDWNTLCLPFDVDIEDSPLKGAEARTLSEATFSDGTLTLNFGEPVPTLTAGTPYIIKWNATDYADLVIKSTSDWNTFASAVNGGNDYRGKFVVLNADITVTDMVGTSSNKFKGTFDGNGHTLNFTKNTSEQYCAPFRYVENATIVNLHTTGSITTSAKFGAGIVAHTKNTTAISNCWSSVSIISSVSGDGSHGGIVGYTEENASNTTLTDCLFDGSITGASTNSCGGLIGWNYDKATLTNCVFRPTSITLADSDNATFSRGSNVTVTNCYYSQNLPGASGQGTAIGEMSDEALLAELGSGWTESETKVVPTKNNDVFRIVNPVFNGVTINATASTTLTPTGGDSDGNVSFKGIYDPKELPGNDASNLYLGAGNNLYWPSEVYTLNAFRAYFHVALSGDSYVREIRMNLDGGEATGVELVHGSRFLDEPSGKAERKVQGAGAWFDLFGRKLNGKPTVPGIYYNKGKKIAITE